MAVQTGQNRENSIDIRMRMALATTNRRLGPEERQRVRPRIARLLDLADEVRAVPLAADDEPAHGFDPSQLDSRGGGSQPV